MPVGALDRVDNRQTPGRLKLFSGNANRALAQEIADSLDTTLGEIKTTQFSDGEIYVQIGESVRGDDIYIVQPTCGAVNYNLMELMIMIDAFRRSSARQITAVIPYFGYARQDRKNAGREAITAKLVANLITTAGADRVVCMDLHAGQIQGFFDIVVDHLYSSPVMVSYLRQKGLVGNPDEVVVVSPDVGGVARARAFAKQLNAPLAIIDKRRPKPNQTEVLNIIGDVKGRHAILVDDMVDTAGTLCAGARLLRDHGVKSVLACATHPVLSGPAIERLLEAPIDELIVTNSIPLPPEKQIAKITTLSVAPLLGEAINRINRGLSISALFD
ncbi:MAG: ribose-phosphate pyrophosphokinase [Candidatus Sericytochromatia bacterium]|nr:ribose-phosphate pyrophosphokinase [Candidatus Sericytochromatia bacterium]